MTDHADTIRREVAAEREMAQQSSVYPNWPLITHAQLKGWYDSHRALRSERDRLVAERQQAIDALREIGCELAPEDYSRSKSLSARMARVARAALDINGGLE